MKKLTYILAAAMAVYALNACGSRDHEAHSAVHSHDSEHNHTGHSHEHATHDHTDHNHSEETHAPGIIEFSSEQAPACHPDRNVVIQFRQAGYRSFVKLFLCAPSCNSSRQASTIWSHCGRGDLPRCSHFRDI